MDSIRWQLKTYVSELEEPFSRNCLDLYQLIILYILIETFIIVLLSGYNPEIVQNLNSPRIQLKFECSFENEITHTNLKNIIFKVLTYRT